MEAFREAFGYFNTFGGNPVSCAAAMAVLQVIDEEGLVENARDVGAYMLDGLRGLDHPLIAEVRGLGLFFGIEFMAGDVPAGAFTAEVVEAMRREGVLLNRLGRHGNVLKLRPPMPFSRGDADFALAALDRVLKALPA